MGAGRAAADWIDRVRSRRRLIVGGATEAGAAQFSQYLGVKGPLYFMGGQAQITIAGIWGMRDAIRCDFTDARRWGAPPIPGWRRRAFPFGRAWVRRAGGFRRDIPARRRSR